VQGLPRDAATWREEMSWTYQDELTAALIEVVDLWGRIGAQIQGARSSQLPKPIRIPRPGQQEQAKRKITTDPAEIRRFLGGLK
jgi:hypothetical protein